MAWDGSRRQVLKLRNDLRKLVSRKRWLDFNLVKSCETVHKLRFSCGSSGPSCTVITRFSAHGRERGLSSADLA